MQDFDAVNALAGGALIGLGASVLLLVNGRVAGVSGILAGLLSPSRLDRSWRALFLIGLLSAGLLGLLTAPSRFAASPSGVPLLAFAGLLVGVGTQLSGGCTSGHGVCGVSRFSPRSIVATAVFVLFGIVTVAVLRALGGGT
jgi:uncharacterized membrane protein YedE/YeeE